MNTYNETANQLDSIRNRNELLFRMAISHLMDVGIRYLTEENIAQTCEEIMKQDDNNGFITNEAQCEIVRTAAEIAKVDHIYLLTYIGRNVYWNVKDNAISYQRAIQLLIMCIGSIYENYYEDRDDALEELMGCGFNNRELKSLGFGYLFDVESEEE